VLASLFYLSQISLKSRRRDSKKQQQQQQQTAEAHFHDGFYRLKYLVAERNITGNSLD
jgi:hypothetical protein